MGCRNFRGGAKGGRPGRGFVLLVVLGVLALLLALCVGFLSFTRGEVNAVAHLRDKNDTADLCRAALDWTVASIALDLCSGNAMDSGKYVSNARGAHWWYRPFEPGFTGAFSSWPAWSYSPPPCVSAMDEAGWVYVPEDYFPEGGVRGRFSVQVLDPNGVPNLNDWLEDCNPTQCQMAHMLMDGYGEQQLERLRAWRDGSNFERTPEPNFAPLRYHEMWRVASRTVRYMHWPFGVISRAGTKVRGIASPNWLTTNTVYLSPYGAEMNCLKSILASDGLPLPGIPAGTPALTLGPNHYYPPTVNEGFPASGATLTWKADPALYADPATLPAGYHGGGKHLVGHLPLNLPFTVRAYVDPDTGRSPVNVNTCYNSGEHLPTNVLGGTPAYALEAVFNVESLRRIVQVGEFYFDADDDPATPAVRATGNGNPTDPDFIQAATTPGPPPAWRWTPGQQQRAWRKHEELRAQMAFQYQETLCRYFTGTYRHSFNRKYPPLGPAGCTVGAASTDYSSTRFPLGLAAFRTKVKADLAALSTGSAIVNVSNAGLPDVAPGRLDQRMADAVYDNIVPGPATISGNYPLAELHGLGLGRDELRPTNAELTEMLDPAAWAESTKAKPHWNANVHGFWDDHWNPAGINYTGPGNGPLPTGALIDSGFKALAGTAPGLHLRPKGLDLALSTAPDGPYQKLPAGQQVPRRQQCFGLDWFSTELTTSTTTFLLVINAQVVEARSLADPDHPNVLHWSQWGVCIELAPDIADESGDYYQSGRPGYYKTLAAAHNESMDKNCPIRHEWSSTDYKSTVVKEWKADLRGIKSAAAATFYGSSAQTRKRVLIRAIWSLNQSSNR